MSEVVEMGKARLVRAVSRGYRNWKTQFGEDFGMETKLSDLSPETLAFLTRGGDRSTFYLFDLIMNIQNLGSGFEFHEMESPEKMAVMDCHLFLLDRMRFEYLKRLGWLEQYPGEEYTLVELVQHFDRIRANLQATAPLLDRGHPDWDSYNAMSPFEKEEFIGKLTAKAIRELEDHSTTL